MAALPTFGPRPNESNSQYLERLNRERMARLGLGDASGRPPTPVPVPPAMGDAALTPEQLAAARARARMPITASDALPPTRLERRQAGPRIEELQAEAARRAAELEKIDRRSEESDRRKTVSAGDAVPSQLKALAGVRINHPKIQEADLTPIDRRTDAPAFYRLAHVAIAKRRTGENHPRIATFMRYVWGLVTTEQNEKVGYVHKPASFLASITGLCCKTIERCQRYAEAHGLIDVLNSLRWDGNEQRRGPNVCVPTVDEEPGPPPDDVAALPAGLVRRTLGGLHRLGALFDLAVRPWGLNKTPLAGRRTSAPA